MSLGFGIIGCGLISRFHALAIRDVRGARFVGCYNRTPEKAERLAAEFNARVYRTVDELLRDPEIDVVCVATPSGAHAEPAIAAARAGKHVVIEKPLEITLPRCDSIIKVCARNQVLLSTIFPSRFHRGSQLLKRAIDQGRFGTLTLADAVVKWFRTQEYYDRGQWRGTWELDGGGALMNQAIHSVDLLLWLMGPIAEVSANVATLAHERIEVEDCASASLRFANGALGMIEATTAAYPGSLKRIAVHGSTGSAVLEEESLVQWEFATARRGDQAVLESVANRTQSGGGAADPAAIGHHGHAAQFRDVVSAIQKGTPLLIDGEQGRQSVATILAIYESARSGRRVAVPGNRNSR